MEITKHLSFVVINPTLRIKQTNALLNHSYKTTGKPHQDKTPREHNVNFIVRQMFLYSFGLLHM